MHCFSVGRYSEKPITNFPSTNVTIKCVKKYFKLIAWNESLGLTDYPTHMFNVHFIGSNDSHFLCIWTTNGIKLLVACALASPPDHHRTAAFHAIAYHFEFSNRRDFYTIRMNIGNEISENWTTVRSGWAWCKMKNLCKFFGGFSGKTRAINERPNSILCIHRKSYTPKNTHTRIIRVTIASKMKLNIIQYEIQMVFF